MTENLALPLSVGTPVEASYGTTTASSISTFTYTPTSAAMNGNTVNNTTYGWYYNWRAATAEKGTVSTAAGTDVDGSICPKGWRLPANYRTDATRSWGALTKAYVDIVENTPTNTGYLYLEASPLSLQRSGTYSGGTFSGATSGCYWSSTNFNTSYTYYLFYDTGYVYPQHNNADPSYNGFSVRCLAVR